ncbi:MAG: hypothetical protein Pg6B_05380 [Candidatus Azobacteroides pseudotrichonymphae]|nr:MAG: hypothetical protein Pg6B_05380 [Candidatus Azobacteroides pseudotrichonymphae]
MEVLLARIVLLILYLGMSIVLGTVLFRYFNSKWVSFLERDPQYAFVFKIVKQWAIVIFVVLMIGVFIWSTAYFLFFFKRFLHIFNKFCLE